MENAFKNLAEEYGPFLEDGRRRVMFTLFFFIFVFVGAFFFSPLLISQLLDIVQLSNVSYVVAAPFQLVGLSVDLALSIALIATAPLILVELYEFITPALVPSERRMMISMLFFSCVLFLVGFVYGAGVMYYGYDIIASFNTSIGVENLWDISTFFSQIILTSVLLGILFQLPMWMLVVLELGFIERKQLTVARRYIYAGIFIFVTLLPPTDGLSLLVMAIPLIGLYELTVVLAYLKKKKEHNVRPVLL